MVWISLTSQFEIFSGSDGIVLLLVGVLHAFLVHLEELLLLVLAVEEAGAALEVTLVLFVLVEGAFRSVGLPTEADETAINLTRCAPYPFLRLAANAVIEARWAHSSRGHMIAKARLDLSIAADISLGSQVAS